ncbi:MAG: LacI family DNA-binding transcriptional regulator [Clostridiales bacterium]|nr:LacI family DNA-binding transcriptional regulator [Clostridiales bacterium]MDD6060104.1 LacI family DNA-binding transcriptional regulator [Ruminococcus sp.]
MATIKEIAQKAGVSIGTVDRVLHDRGMVNSETKKRILELIKELNYQPNHVAQALAVKKKNLKLGFVLPEQSYHPYFAKVYKSAVEKAKRLEQYSVQVCFFELIPKHYQEENYWNNFWNQIKSMDGVVTLALDSFSLYNIVQKLHKEKIPVVYYNHYYEDEHYLAYVGCDYEKAGRLAAGLCALAGGENARVCIYSESYEKEKMQERLIRHQERLSGFQKEIKERYPKMKILDKRLISYNQIDNYISAEDMLKKYPDVNIVYVANPGDYGICEAIYKADKKHQVRIITNDLVDKQIEMMQKGMISATICQEPEKQAEQSLELLFRYLALGMIPENKMCFTNLSIHITQNVE